VTDLQLENGVYSGELLKDKPNGKGELVYWNGDTFTGTFKDGLPFDGIHCFDESKIEFTEDDLVAPTAGQKTETEQPKPDLSKLMQLPQKQAEQICDSSKMMSTDLLRRARAESAASANIIEGVNRLDDRQQSLLGEIAFLFPAAFRQDALTSVLFGGDSKILEEFLAIPEVRACLLSEEYEAGGVYYALPSRVRSFLLERFGLGFDVFGDKDLRIDEEVEVSGIATTILSSPIDVSSTSELVDQSSSSSSSSSASVPTGIDNNTTTIEEVEEDVEDDNRTNNSILSDRESDNISSTSSADSDSSNQPLLSRSEASEGGQQVVVSDEYQLLKHSAEVVIDEEPATEEQHQQPKKERVVAEITGRHLELTKRTAMYHVARLKELAGGYASSSGPGFEVHVARLLMERDNISRALTLLAAVAKISSNGVRDELIALAHAAIELLQLTPMTDVLSFVKPTATFFVSVFISYAVITNDTPLMSAFNN